MPKKGPGVLKILGVAADTSEPRVRSRTTRAKKVGHKKITVSTVQVIAVVKREVKIMPKKGPTPKKAPPKKKKK